MPKLWRKFDQQLNKYEISYQKMGKTGRFEP